MCCFYAQGTAPGYNLTAVVYVADQYGASARATAGFNVLPLAVPITALAANISSALSSSLSTFNVEKVFQMVAITSSGIGSSCTDAAACGSLRTTMLGAVAQAVTLQGNNGSISTSLISYRDIFRPLHFFPPLVLKEHLLTFVVFYHYTAANESPSFLLCLSAIRCR